jgi:hypothetical protein
MNTTENSETETHKSQHKRDDFDHYMSTSDILMISGLAGFGMLCPLVCICGINYYQKHYAINDIQEPLV